MSDSGKKTFKDIQNIENIGMLLWSFISAFQIAYVVLLLCPTEYLEKIHLNVIPWEYGLSLSSFIIITIVVYFVINYGLTMYLAMDYDSENTYRDTKSVTIHGDNITPRRIFDEYQSNNDYVMSNEAATFSSLPLDIDESNKKEIVDEEAFVPNICDIPPELWNQVCIMKKRSKEK